MKNSFAEYSSFNLTEIPSYNRLTTQEMFPSTLVYQMREKVLEGISFSTAITYRRQNLAIKFKELACQVIQDEFFTTSPTRLTSNFSYQKIIGMGKDAIPLLINHLDHRPVFWLPALTIITDETPVKPEHEGIISEIVKDWKKWAQENGYTY